jgi:hypothetical protein
MKRLVLGLVVIMFSIPSIGCGEGGGGTTGAPAPAAGSTAADSTAKGAGNAQKGVTGPLNPDGPKNDR